jgi:hypothetical protein
MFKRHGGVPLQRLSPRKRRQLTSHGQGHATNAVPQGQGSKEIERRRRQMEKQKPST